MAFNPFLMETDYAAQSSSAAAMYTTPSIPMDTSASSNPFLSFGAEPEPVVASMPPGGYSMMDQNIYGGVASSGGGGGGDNPFLSYDMGPSVSAAAAASSNPFADFAAPAPIPASQPPFSSQMSVGGGTMGANAYFASTADMSYAHQTTMSAYEQQQQYHQPEVTNLIDTSEPEVIHSHQSQTTKNLLDSVTGVLEATSDSLLDRLRVNAPSPTAELPSPTPSPRSPSPDLLGGDLMSDCPPVPPPSANPLSPSPNPMMDSILDLYEPSSATKPVVISSSAATSYVPTSFISSAASAAPSSTHVELMGLYNTPQPSAASSMASILTTTNAVPTPKPTPMEVDTAPASQPLVDFVIEPATPLVKEVPPQEPQLPTSPPVIQSPPEMIHAGQQPPPRPQPPSPARSPVHSPVREEAAVVAVVQPPSRPSTGPPVRPAPPPAAPRSPVASEKPLPSRPPPPVPAAPKMTPSPQPPAYSAQPPPLPTSAPPIASDSVVTNIFAGPAPAPMSSPFAASVPAPVISTGADIFGSSKPQQPPPSAAASVAFKQGRTDTFDAFDAKFEQLSETGVSSGGAASAFNEAFGGPPTITTSAWGTDGQVEDGEMGFGSSGFDSFLSMTEPPPVPQSTPAKLRKDGGGDDFDNEDEDKEMSITIRPRNENDLTLTITAPALAPPPKSPAISTHSAYSEENNTSNYVPFLSQSANATTAVPAPMVDNSYAEARRQNQMNRTESGGESPQTPLYEEDTSQPLEDFPRTKYTCDGWDMQVRYPNKKVTFGGQRSWKAVFVRIDHQGDVPVVKIYGKKGDKEPIQEIPLQSSYSISDISAQQFDQYGKIFTAKLQFVYYKERPGVRPGQIGKASRLSHKLSAFAAYAITGDPSGVKEFGSDLKKLGLPLEHAPQVSQLVKLGTQSYDDMKQFSVYIEETLFHLSAHRDRALNYKTEEIQVTIVDEYYVEQDLFGVVTRQIARVRVMFLSFLNGLAEIEMGVNDMRRQGKEIVGRHDICPVPTEEWIRMEDIEFSNIVDPVEFGETQLIKFKPPDASYLELMRFRVRPPKRRELPLQVKTTFTTTGQRIEIRSDILVPGYTSRKLGQIPCEDVMVRFPIPETWIYMFRVEKHFRYGSVKSAHRRSGKVKGVERILGALDVVEASLMETTSGQAKYEHHHRAIVWRIPRLPKEGQGAYTTHSFFCHITLQPHEQIPDNLSKYCYVEFTMPHTTVSHTVCRSISVPTSDEPPEKACRYLSRHEYTVEIEHKEGITPASYSAAAALTKEEPIKEAEPVRGEFEEQKFDSDFSDEE